MEKPWDFWVLLTLLVAIIIGGSTALISLNARIDTVNARIDHLTQEMVTKSNLSELKADIRELRTLMMPGIKPTVNTPPPPIQPIGRKKTAKATQ